MSREARRRWRLFTAIVSSVLLVRFAGVFSDTPPDKVLDGFSFVFGVFVTVMSGYFWED
jgi:hypothetical protein